MKSSFGLALLVLTALTLAGCNHSEMSMADMKAPERPAELDQLEPLLGHWEGTWECSMPGMDQPIKGVGTNVVSWEADRWVLVERMSGDMGEMGKFSGIGVWTWNPKRGCFDNWWYDSWGSTGHGTATYDAATRTWKTKGQSTDPMTGEMKQGEGTMKILPGGKMEWTYAERDVLGRAKGMEMKGTSVRK
ncbi:MAG: DUF1579 family protein [Phycisphaerales bacterium]|nr:DUF1579 family protein [Phycisphaerales bacterium]